MIRCEIGVVAHHTRAAQARQLANEVDACFVSVDEGTLGPGINHLRVWDWLHQHNGGAEWLAVVEDDCLPVGGFRDQLNQALAVAPTPVVSLYLGTGNPIHWQPRIAAALDTDAHWLTADHLFHAVAVCIRTDLLPMRLDTRRPIDEAISRWCRTDRHTVAYTVPSLVEHDDSRPVIEHRHDGTTRDKPRRAWQLGTRDQWTTKAGHLA